MAKKPLSPTYGGQAVIEGVMMRGRDNLAVAVRKNNGEIVVHQEPVSTLAKKYPVLKYPLLRGIVALGESFTVGMKVLMFSANQFVEEEDKPEVKLSPWEGFLMVGLALVMAILLFVVLPLMGRSLIGNIIDSSFWGNVFESVLRMLILVGYISAVSLLKDIQRVFAYHGAEHKTINAFEAKKELTVENVRQFTTFHPRCGTSFLLFVVVVSAVIFSFLHYESLLMRFVMRIALLPLVAGISYEIIRFTGRHQEFFLWKALSMPGYWLQKLTTREPDDQMLEVAITSLQTVLEADAAESSKEKKPSMASEGEASLAEKPALSNETTS